MRTRRLARIGRLATLPETRRLIVAAAQSETLREMARQAVQDRAGLVRGLRGPANPRDLLLRAARHPAVRELANAGLLFLPGRYLPLGLAASWATRRVLRRHVDPPPEELGAAGMGPPNRRDRGLDSTTANATAMLEPDHAQVKGRMARLDATTDHLRGSHSARPIQPHQVRFSAVASNRRALRPARGTINGIQAPGDDHGPDSEA